MTIKTGDYMELLSPALLTKYADIVKEIDNICNQLGVLIGWHYILDITWILKNLKCQPGSIIIDAGAGNGAAQFVLAARGYNIISVDYRQRFIPLTAALRFPISKAYQGKFTHTYIDHLEKRSSKNKWEVILKRIQRLRMQDLEILLLPILWIGRILLLIKTGKIKYYQADMRQMKMVENDSVDAIISVSAIEHMKVEDIPAAISEFERVLKPDGRMIITTSAAREKDWFHEITQGWSFSKKTLKDLFKFDNESTSDISSEYDQIMTEIKLSTELKHRADFLYKLTGYNSMPDGIWNPQYCPVGILKIKKGIKLSVNE
jgi:2-polyprenyl-3-methyl-5-hydroxy-6-metoxy-1,4-benzoquinol methylase